MPSGIVVHNVRRREEIRVSAGKVAVLAVLGIVAIIGVGLGGRYVLAPVIGAIEERETVHRGAYRIQAYEQFYRWQEEAAAVDTKLIGYLGRSDARSQTECVGLLAVRADIVAKYNAASRQIRTQGEWKPNDLPAVLDQKDKSTCG